MKAYGRVDLSIHFFLTSALAGGEWSASRPCRFTPGERAPGIHWIGGWVGPRAGLDDVKNRKFLTLPGLELRPFGHPSRSQSLYRLHYRGSSLLGTAVTKLSSGNRVSLTSQHRDPPTFLLPMAENQGSLTSYVIKFIQNLVKKKCTAITYLKHKSGRIGIIILCTVRNI
jgi:hypothetical protein